MKKIIWASLGILVGLVAIALVLAAFHPDKYEVTRHRTLKGSPIFGYGMIADFSHWNLWSPWFPMDTAAVYTYSEKTTGVGASMRWEGKKIGIGTLTFTEVVPFEKITYDLLFEEPFKSKSQGQFLFSLASNALQVTWEDRGELPFPFGRLMDMVWGFDAMIGRDFEIGLSRLDSVISALPAVEMNQIQMARMEPTAYLTLPVTTIPDSVHDQWTNAYSRLLETSLQLGLEPAGSTVCFYHVFEPEKVDMEPGLPVKGNIPVDANPPAPFKLVRQPAQEVLRFVHVGDIREMHYAYDALAIYMKAFGYEEVSGPMEEMGATLATSSATNGEVWISWPVKKK